LLAAPICPLRRSAMSSSPPPVRPAFSLLRQPAWRRLLGAAVAVALIWLLIAWAMGPGAA